MDSFYIEDNEHDNNFIYCVYCKDDNGITILKKAYKSKLAAYNYAITKITTLLNIINNEFKQTKPLPVNAQVIYTLFNMKHGDYIDQYEYFKQHYIKFFQFVAKPPVMFFVCKLQLI
jgi:hypothetical protein